MTATLSRGRGIAALVSRSMLAAVLALFVAVVTAATPDAALAQGDPGGSDRALLRGGSDWNDTGWHIVPLYGDRAACIRGLGFSVQVEFWSLFGDPVVLSHASYDLSDGNLRVEIFRDVGPIEEFDCAGGRIATVGVFREWAVHDEGRDLVEFGAPAEAFREHLSVYGFTFSMDVTPNLRPTLPHTWYIESFSGVFTNGGESSFNVPGSPSWAGLFHRTGESFVGEFRDWRPLPASDARGRLAALFDECPIDDACSTRVLVDRVIRGSIYGLVYQLTRRSDAFRDLYYDSPKEALVDELIAGAVGGGLTTSGRERREELLNEALDAFDDEIDPDLVETWAAAREHERRSRDARNLANLGERLRAEIASEGEASDGLRGRVRGAANAVRGEWGEERAELLLAWADHEEAKLAPGVETISAGSRHACGLTSRGDAYCWGRTWNGRLGRGPYSGDLESRPGRVVGGHTFVSISAGGHHTCGIASEGAVYCWGDSNSIGHRSTEAVTRPVRISGGQNFIQVSAGDTHTCGLTSDGVAYCTDGSGIETGLIRVPGDHVFAQISVGDNHTCGVTPQGAAYCWGRGDYGQLGNGSEPSHQSEPVRVSGGHTFAQISAGSDHTCGLTPDGVAYCWGSGDHGRLGHGSESDESEPVRVSGDYTFAQISAGWLHTCGITRGGDAYCWGNGANGQLGNGASASSSDSPVAYFRLQPDRVLGGHSFAQISAGWFSCGVTTEGIAYCWSYGSSGQLGNGSTSGADRPVRVSGGHVFATPPRPAALSGR